MTHPPLSSVVSFVSSDCLFSSGETPPPISSVVSRGSNDCPDGVVFDTLLLEGVRGGVGVGGVVPDHSGRKFHVFVFSGSIDHSGKVGFVEGVGASVGEGVLAGSGCGLLFGVGVCVGVELQFQELLDTDTDVVVSGAGLPP